MADEAEEIRGWIAGRLPDGWFSAPPELIVDREEVIVVGTLAPPELAAETAAEARTAAELARIERFREQTRSERMQIAAEAERRFDRKLSWGASSGTSRRLFTTAGVPVMTRLRYSERSVLDTLVDAGVARSRSDALAWCVRLVGKHQADWIKELRDALVDVERVRTRGPDAASG
jgi:hypothetical protein